MKYQVGDKVKIREDLVVNEDYGVDSFTPEMAKFRGQVATIVKVKSDAYTINLDNNDWNWTDEMFEGKIGVIKPMTAIDLLNKTNLEEVEIYS